MNLRLQLIILLAALRRNSVRAALALASVALGIAAVLISIALGDGAQREMDRINDQAGRNLFVIKAGKVQAKAGRRGGWSMSTRLRMRDAQLLSDQIMAIQTIVPVSEAAMRARLRQESMQTNVRGTIPQYLEARNFRLAAGRALDAADDATAARVAVVGSFVARKLNAGGSILGERIWIQGIPFEVVGQLAEKGMSSDGTNEDDQIVIPLRTAMRRVLNVDYLTSMLVQVRVAGDIPAVQERVRPLLREAHRLDMDAKDDVEILSMIKASEISRINSQFLRSISQMFATITLVIGSAGLFALTYLNVKDRTAEIGLRMAVGARRRDIAGLFIGETIILSVIGGLVGVLAGAAGVAVLSRLTDWHMLLSLRALVLPFAIAVLLGLAVGVVPAVRASRLMPMVALRAT